LSRALSDPEKVARLLFADDMVSASTGEIKASAFPTDELIQREWDGRKKSLSVDRCRLLRPLRETLREKAAKFENPEKNRSKWGFAVALTKNIRGIQTPDGQQVFDVHEDAIQDGDHPKWDHVHAKLVSAQQGHSRSLVRGYRLDLIEVFSQEIVSFDDGRYPRNSTGGLESWFSGLLWRFHEWCGRE